MSNRISVWSHTKPMGATSTRRAPRAAAARQRLLDGGAEPRLRRAARALVGALVVGDAGRARPPPRAVAATSSRVGIALLDHAHGQAVGGEEDARPRGPARRLAHLLREGLEQARDGRARIARSAPRRRSAAPPRTAVAVLGHAQRRVLRGHGHGHQLASRRPRAASASASAMYGRQLRMPTYTGVPRRARAPGPRPGRA